MSLLHFRCKERRRTQRVAIGVPIVVHGMSDDGQKFCQQASSVSVNQHGASFEFGQVVAMGQLLRVVNENNNRKAECHVVDVYRKRDGRVVVGVEFNTNEPNFWNMTFPSPGAKPLRKAAPTRITA